MLAFEKKHWNNGIEHIAGIDEAGRGPLAGPVVASAVILPNNINLPEVQDSKKLSERKREKLYVKIFQNALTVGVGIVHANDIDSLNILKATELAMKKAVGSLNIKPEILLIDGPHLKLAQFTQENIIKGDSLSLSIASASIIAKVTRDRLMKMYDIVFPKYGFAKHKGYGTKQHLQAIQELYATPIHRQSFKPVFTFLPRVKHYNDSNRLGELGEQLVAVQLINYGYQVLEMNYLIPKVGEIDIIHSEENCIVFTEVKTQLASSKWANNPKDKIDEIKRDKIMQTAQVYLEENDIDCEIRFDIAEVVIGDGKPKIEIIKGGLSGY
jgi:ribonuclease HII